MNRLEMYPISKVTYIKPVESSRMLIDMKTLTVHTRYCLSKDLFKVKMRIAFELVCVIASCNIAKLFIKTKEC